MSWTLLLGVVLILGVALAATLSRRAELVRMSRSASERERGVRLGSEAAQLHRPVIDLSRCMGCGTCVDVCPEDVLELVHGQAVVVRGARCEGISACERECPVGAIEIGIANLSERGDVPAISRELEAVGSPGLFLAGEVTARSLIKTAVEHGTQVAREVARRIGPMRADVDRVPSVTARAERTLALQAAGMGGEDAMAIALATEREEEDALDLVIVGAGPAGLACALEAKRLGLSFQGLEQETFTGGTVAKYPRRKLVLTQPVDLPLFGRLDQKTYLKEDLVALWQGIADEHDLPIECGVVFTGLERTDRGGFEVLTTERTYRARHVCLALGRRGVPNTLGVPGEELPKVAYSLFDAGAYEHRRILVVGGGDSAIEAALGLAQQAGNQVTLSYRKESFFRLRSRNAEHVATAIAAGKLDVRYSSRVTRIGADEVVLEVDGQTEPVRLPNDDVFILAGGVAPTELLGSAGVSFDPQLREAISVAEGERDGSEAPAEIGGLTTSLKVGFALALFALAWAGWHSDYYQLERAVRPAHEKHWYLRPGLGMGLAFGVTSALLIIANLLYLVRRSPMFRFERGSLRGWMTCHVATGLFAVPCALLHAAMEPRATVGGRAFWLLVALLVTGAIGRYLYAWVPRAANGRELELDEVRKRLHRVDDDWDAGQRRFGDHAREAVYELIERRQWRGSFPGRVMALVGLRFDLARTVRELRREGRAAGVPADQLRDALGLARRAHRHALMAAHYEDLRAIAGTWRYLHRWIAVLMVLLVVLHVVYAFSYSAFFGGGVR